MSPVTLAASQCFCMRSHAQLSGVTQTERIETQAELTTNDNGLENEQDQIH